MKRKKRKKYGPGIKSVGKKFAEREDRRGRRVLQGETKEKGR